MKKIFNTLVGLIIVVAVLVAGGALYLEKFLKDQTDYQINALIEAGFDQSSYADLKIDFAKQNIVLTDLKVASSQNNTPNISIASISLNKVNPLSMSQITTDQLIVQGVQYRQGNASYDLEQLNVDQASYIYPSSEQKQPIFNNMREIVQFAHQIVDYKQITLMGFSHKDFKDDISKFDKATFTKNELIYNLPNDLNLHLEGVKIAPHHLDAQTSQMLAAYNIQSLEGIIDVSFNYDQSNKSGTFSINNLYLGGLASLNGETNFIMNDERFARFYEINNYQNFIKTIPFNQAKLDYEDLGLYQYFIDNQSRLSGMQADDLKSQLYFGIVILAGQIQDLEMQKRLSDPLFKFHENPNKLKLLIEPQKPIRFEQYLNLYDLNGLTKDLNPTIQYL